jgi:inactivated superfamily I helicase
MTDIFKKKYDASQESKLMSFAVQKTMIMKNKEQSKLAMIQKMDLLNNQIDTAESRPNFNVDDPPARWLFATKSVAKLMKEFDQFDKDEISESESFLTPHVRYEKNNVFSFHWLFSC